MITNISTADDYFSTGKELLNFSWEISVELLKNLDLANHYDDIPEEMIEQYWKSAKRHLTTALSTTQQGVEFLLKGKIVQISPFLIIANLPQNWPSPYEETPIDFSAFRTIDAQDLIRVHDIFSDNQLPEDFRNRFHDLRNKRNRIIHSVHKDMNIHITEVIETILFMFKSLVSEEPWTSLRLNFLMNAPYSGLESEDSSVNIVSWELSLVIKLLSPSQVKKFFNINKKQRKYICPQCFKKATKDIDYEFKLAELNPKEPGSNVLFCPICNKHFTIIRKLCRVNKCKGDVFSEDGICLTCGYQE